MVRVLKVSLETAPQGMAEREMARLRKLGLWVEVVQHLTTGFTSPYTVTWGAFVAKHLVVSGC